MTEHTYTVADIMALGPCYRQEIVEEIWADRKALSLAEIFALDIPASDLIWFGLNCQLLSKEQIVTFAQECAERAKDCAAAYADAARAAAAAYAYAYAAYAAVYADAAAYAAVYAAYAAARAAAAASYVAARAAASYVAARAAERRWQLERLKEMLG